MPLVVVARNPKKLDDVRLQILLGSLQESVASALTCDNLDGKLIAGDIEIWVQDFGPHDYNTADVEIIIWANEYPERRANLDERRRALCKSIRDAIPENGEIRGWVWILLQPASFGEF